MVRSILAVLLVVFLIGVPWIVLAEDAVEAKPIQDDWYGQLSLRSGALFDFDASHDREFLTVPLFGYKAVVAEAGIAANFLDDGGFREFKPEAAVFAVTYHVGDLQDVGMKADWGKYVALSVGPAFWYDFETEETGWAILASFLDLSFDNGNVDRQRDANGD